MTLGNVEDAVLEYDGPNVIEETSATTGDLFLATTHAPGIDAPLVATDGAGTFVLQTNARGDVVAAANANGMSITEEQRLDPWGEREMRLQNDPTVACVEGNESLASPSKGQGDVKFSLPTARCATHALVLGRFGIGGARSHPDTKLVDLRNRVYAPHLRTFLSRDPLGNVDSEGLWSYAAGDPINVRDPLGLSAKQDDPAVAAAIASTRPDAHVAANGHVQVTGEEKVTCEDLVECLLIPPL